MSESLAERIFDFEKRRHKRKILRSDPVSQSAEDYNLALPNSNAAELQILLGRNHQRAACYKGSFLAYPRTSQLTRM
jgi:hypothetical protein